MRNLTVLSIHLRYLVENFPSFELYLRAAFKAHPSLSGFEVFDYFKAHQEVTSAMWHEAVRGTRLN
jgi:hypothetical protein